MLSAPSEQLLGARSGPQQVSFGTVSDDHAFASLRDDWDALVRAMPRPSPYLLHGWLSEWWRHYGGGRRLCVQIAVADGRLVGALPVCVNEDGVVHRLEFVGAGNSALADLLLADEIDPSVATTLARRAASQSGHHVADLFGLPGESRLVEALAGSGLRLLPRIEAPVLDLAAGWDSVYTQKTSSRRRGLHRRRRRQLAGLGALETSVAASGPELTKALEHAFELYARRWHGRPDASHFVTRRGRPFERAAMDALVAADVPRIVLLSLDGRPIAFTYAFLLGRRMYLHKLAFDPAYAAYSPGIVNQLDTLAFAAEEGVEKVEFLGGAERYKLEFADRFEPIYEAVGLANGALGRAAAERRVASIRLRLRLKRSPAANWLHHRGAAPARRALARARTSRRHGEADGS
jgi:CelD/BcsL family acetyltransferase involved in cellulose biosynthesis